jgi:hypothetical protein
MNQQPVIYANAEVRGKVRTWKNLLQQRYRIFDAAYRNARLKSVLATNLDNFVYRGSRTGRYRAFKKIQQAFGPGVKLESLCIDGKHSQALWSILKPRIPVTVDAPDDSGHNQFCVTVNYVMAGYLPGFDRPDYFGYTEGLWTLEVPDHALGRAVERSGMLHPETIIRDAHRNLLDLPSNLIISNGVLDTDKHFLVKAGAGAFVCELRCGRDISLDNGFSVSAFVPTWIDDNQLHEDQVPLCEKGKPGERLGDCWLMPEPLRHIVETEPRRLEVLAWRPQE